MIHLYLKSIIQVEQTKKQFFIALDIHLSGNKYNNIVSDSLLFIVSCTVFCIKKD